MSSEDKFDPVVQRALTRLADEATGPPFHRAPSIGVLESLQSTDSLNQAVARLQSAALLLRANGYRAGIEIGPKIEWPELEQVTDREAAARQWADWGSRFNCDLAEDVRSIARKHGGHVEATVDDNEFVFGYSLEFLRGVADALLDLKDSVNARLNESRGAGLRPPSTD